MPAPSEESFRVVSSNAPYWFAVSGRCSNRTTTHKPRNQSREAGPSSRIFDSMETSAKCISLGPAEYRKRVSNSVRVSPAQVYGGVVHRGGPQQVLVMEQEVKALLEKGAIECVPRSNRESRFNRRFFIVSKKDGGVVSNFRSFEFWSTTSCSSSSRC